MNPELIVLHAFEFSAHHHYSGWAGVPASLADFHTQITLALQRYAAQTPNAPPAVESPLINVAQFLWNEWRRPWPLTSLELTEDDGLTARITNNQITLIHPGQFSAAHRTYAPRLSEAENRALYGKCVNLHGHNYRAEAALPPHAQLPAQLWDEFDHVNLSADIPDLRGRNVVTEAIAELIARRAPEAEWVRVWELPDFFAEYHRADASFRLGRRRAFRAQGRPLTMEVVVRGDLNPRTETAYDLGLLDSHCLAVIRELDYTSSTPPRTGEEVTRDLWTRLAERLGAALTALRLWTTRRHQFSIGG
jgi:hypothetical protein